MCSTKILQAITMNTAGTVVLFRYMRAHITQS